MKLNVHRTVAVGSARHWPRLNGGSRRQIEMPMTGVRHFRVARAAVKRGGSETWVSLVPEEARDGGTKGVLPMARTERAALAVFRSGWLPDASTGRALRAGAV